MKTIGFLISVLMFTVGCGDNNAPETFDAGPGDACVQAQGNCGCVLHEDISYVTGKTVTTVVCP